jgi:hypothetical protein
VLRNLIYFAGAVLMSWAVAAAGADKSVQLKSAQPKPKYDLQFRPVVGMSYAYESSTDHTITFRAAANATRRSGEWNYKDHTQIIVSSEQVTQLADGLPVARRVTFGPNCFTATQEDKQPTRKVRMVYAGKTVNFRLNRDTDQIEQDFGVKSRPEDMRMLRNAMKGTTALFAGHPVTVGERWRADDGLRAIANLRDADTISSIVTLKAVRVVDGSGQVADLAVSAAVITAEHEAHAEVSLEGMVTVDVKSGQVLSCDLVGEVNVTGGIGATAKTVAVSLNGTGRTEIHTRGRMLPPASGTPAATPAATQPSDNIAAGDPTP